MKRAIAAVSIMQSYNFSLASGRSGLALSESEDAIAPGKMWISHDSEVYISVNSLLRRGWTRLLIRTWLGEPDRRLAHSSLPGNVKMRLFRRDRVERIESTPEFSRHLRKSLAHRVGTSRSGSVRREGQLLERAEVISIEVPKLARDKLRADAVGCITEQDSAGNFEQIELRYLLTHLMDIDDELFNLSGLPNLRRAGWIYRCRVYHEIAETYPHLAEECERCVRQSDSQLLD